MKKILSVLCFALFACGTMYADLSGKKIYVNPGHGTYGSEDRLMATIGIPASAVRDGYGFSESHTNLWKAEALQKKLSAAGANVKMSRTKNGISQELSVIATEAQNFGADYFISIHSNAHVDGTTTNYPVILYKGKENGSYVNSDSKYRGQVLWPYLFECMGSGLDPNSAYSATSMRVCADMDFMGGSATTYINGVAYTGYYGVLRHGRPGYLSEGFFHTYQPARQRALNADYCRQEGVRYYRGIAKYYGHANETKGYIMGVVKDGQKTMTRSTSLSATSWYYASDTHDQYRPINGAKVTLYNSSKVKVAEYTTDSYYNGVFVFNDLTPGTYYLDIMKSGYASLTSTQRKVTVTAHKTTYPIIKLTAGTYVPDADFGETVLDFKEVWNYGETSGKTADWTSSFTGLRNMAFGAGKLYVVNTTSGIIHVINAQTGAKVFDLNMTGVDGGTIKVIDCKHVGGKLVACNLATAANNNPLKVYVWDTDASAPRVLLNTTDYAGFPRIGDCLGVKGNLTSGALLFASTNADGASSIISYAITNGTCSTTPTTIALTKDGKAVNLGSSPRVSAEGDKYWAMGSNVNPGLYTAAGAHSETIPADATSSVVSGNAFNHFSFKGKSYGFATTYTAGTGTASLKDGRASLVDPSSGWASATSLAEYPSAGLGTTRNTSFSTSLATAVNGTVGIEMWILVHNQGIAYYKHGTAPTYTIDIPTDQPTITVNPTSLSFSGKEGTAIASQKITVTGANLTATPTVTGGTDNFTVQSSLSATGGTITVTPKSGLAIGTHKSTLTIAANGASQQVSLSVTITSATVQTTPDFTLGNVRFFLQGGKLDVPADNEALWELFKPDYLTYYGISRADQPIANVTTFASSTMQDFMTNSKSTWKWLGDHISAITTAAGRTLDTEILWRYAVGAFFNQSAEATSGYNGNADFTTAGKPEAWQHLYTFAHQPTKSGDTFLGWYNNADGTGSKLTACPSSGDVYACWKAGATTDVESIEKQSAIILPTFAGVEIFFEGTEPVAVYTINGTQIAAGVATNYYTCNLPAGMYIIRVGAETFKFVK